MTVWVSLAVSVAVGCGDDAEKGHEAASARGDLDASCSSDEDCKDGLFCPRGGASKGVCSVECDNDLDCELHAGDEYSCSQGVCAIGSGAGGTDGAVNSGASGGDGESGSGGTDGGGTGSGGTGSGGTGSGGSGGTDGGGTSGNNGCPATAATQTLIDDFEDGDITVASLDGRNGQWWARANGFLTPVDVAEPGLDESNYLLSAVTPIVDEEPVGLDSVWVEFVKPRGAEVCSHDIRSFTGVRFTVESFPQDGLLVQLITLKDCGTYRCDHEFGETVVLPADGEVSLPFSGFSQAVPDGSSLNLKDVVGLRFLVGGFYAFGIDNLELY